MGTVRESYPGEPAPGCGPEAERLLRPDRLGGRYQLGRLLGSGGMADVFVATDAVLEREVAIKVLRPELAADPAAVERFRREALLLAGADSPHVVAIHDLHVGPDGCYLVLRRIDGRTLDEVVGDDGPLPPRRALRVLGEVLDGLAHLHARRLVHRDLTPSNVVVDRDDHAVLLDLGVARDARRRSLTPADATYGTPGFMAPEHVRGRATDHRTDQYQAGLLVLFALTGGDPVTGPCGFLGPAPPDADPRSRWGGPAAIEDLLGRLDPLLAGVIARALAPSPDDRFVGVASFRDALDGAICALEARAARPSSAPRPVFVPDELAPRPGRPRAVTRPMRRPARPRLPAPAMLALAAAVVLLVALVALLGGGC